MAQEQNTGTKTKKNSCWTRIYKDGIFLMRHPRLLCDDVHRIFEGEHVDLELVLRRTITTQELLLVREDQKREHNLTTDCWSEREAQPTGGV